MADEPRDDNPESAPQGTTEERAAEGQGDYSAMADDELERLARQGGEESVPPPPADSEDEMPPEFRGKTPQELARMYQNLREMQSRQTNELGELRKLKESVEQEREATARYQEEAGARHLYQDEIPKMNPDQKSVFFDKFSDDPDEALDPLVERKLRPVLIRLARAEFAEEVRRLKDTTRESLIPYDETEVNRVISAHNRDGRNQLFDQYGSKAFEVAYNIYRNQHIDEAVNRKIGEMSERARQEGLSEDEQRKKAFTESAGVSRRSGEPDYEHMSFEELEAIVEKTRR